MWSAATTSRLQAEIGVKQGNRAVAAEAEMNCHPERL
jgi:hypothetical protein